ncbi:MAG: phosphatase PAP2 family protein [Steroidobacteraceae bacterium]
MMPANRSFSPPRHALVALILMTGFHICTVAHAGTRFLGIDHQLAYDDHGIWARGNQDALIALMMAGEVGVALWEGGEDRLGRTMWQSIDATVVGGLSATVLKRVFTRERPADTTNSNAWFKGGSNGSFPSGEVTVTSAIVTPLVLEYGRDHPAVYALEALPLYDAIARLKVRGHWQTDVIAGFALGTVAGYYMHRRSDTPLVLDVLPHGFYVGFKKKF